MHKMRLLNVSHQAVFMGGPAFPLHTFWQVGGAAMLNIIIARYVRDGYRYLDQIWNARLHATSNLLSNAIEYTNDNSTIQIQKLIFKK